MAKKPLLANGLVFYKGEHYIKIKYGDAVDRDRAGVLLLRQNEYVYIIALESVLRYPKRIVLEKKTDRVHGAHYRLDARAIAAVNRFI